MISLKKIIVFGATGGTGKQVVEQILQTEHHQVTVVIRNPDAFTVRHKNLQIIRGMFFNLKHLKTQSKKKMQLFLVWASSIESPPQFILKVWEISLIVCKNIMSAALFVFRQVQ